MQLSECHPAPSFSFSLSAAEMVRAQALQTPLGCALSDDCGDWTYAQLIEAAERVRGLLNAQGLTQGATVAIYATRSAALVPALLGTWFSGCALLILDESYPAARLAWQTSFVQASALLSIGSEPLPLELQALPVHARINLPQTPEEFLRMPAAPAAAVPVAGTDRAYILFTSGTTGRPKAISVSHRCLPHFLGWYHRTFRPDRGDVFSMFSGLGHDPLMRDILVPLTCGARLCAPPDEMIRLPRKLLQWSSLLGVTRMHLTPSLGRMLSLMAAATRQTLPLLRDALFGGEPLRAEEATAFRAMAPNATITNCYGTSETPQIMACYRIHPGDEIPQQGLVPIGLPVDDAELLILRPDRTPADEGESGEIAIRSRYLADGYLHAPALTAERFLANPLGQPGDGDDRIYRTGDQGTCRGGKFEFSGRGDTQVKIRGFRVELEEIELALRLCPGVAAAVVALDAEAIDPQLCAFVKAGGSYDEAACRAALAGRLPAYMRPSSYVAVEEFPLTPNGKLDRRALLNLRRNGVQAS